jgi:hypothetical protein
MNPDRAARMGKGRFGRFAGFWLLAWLALASAPAAWGAIRYVKADAAGANTGASWANAYTDLQTALAAAQSGDEIWVAAGTYKPTTGTDQTKSFVMPTGVGMYGGFAGTETARAQRDWSAHATILSGDIGTSGTATDNSYHVVVGANSATLDGFTITGGYGGYGGGMDNTNVSPTVINCTFTKNWAYYGGGMYNTNASLTVTSCAFLNNSVVACGGGMHGGAAINCTFANNTAAFGIASMPSDYGRGGGIYDGTAINCTFTKNWAYYGGGMYGATATSCTFTNNTASDYGGGMFGETATNCAFANNTANYNGGGKYGGTSTNCAFANNASFAGGGVYGNNAFNCSFTRNSAYYGGGMCVVAAGTISNCIFWNDSTENGAERADINSGGYPTLISCCDIQGSGGSGTSWWASAYVTDGGGNIDADLLFVDAANPAGPDGIWRTADDGLRLKNGSPCINAGTATGAPITDILGNPRFGLPDIGAYEYQASPPPPGAPTVTSAAALTNNAKPTWTWTSGGDGGNGTFRYQLGATASDNWATTTALTYAPATALADGAHALYVEESDAAGNWSAAGSYTVTVDTTPPGVPTVTATLATPLRPTWTWTASDAADTTFRYQLDSTGGAWTTTTALQLTAFADLSLGAHVFYVQESDAAGNWSASGSCSIAAITAAQDWRGYR